MSEPFMPLVRASGLPSYADCGRRGAARMFREIIEDAGFELRRTTNTVGAAVGTGCHHAAAYTLGEMIAGHGLGNESEAEDRAVSQLAAEIEHGVRWDDATRNADEGKRQVARMVRVYREAIAPTIEPVAVEERLNGIFDKALKVSGEPDCYEAASIRDLKTGKIARANFLQYGVYALLSRTHGRPVHRIGEDYLPRVSIKREQPPPERLSIDARVAEIEAERTLRRIAADLAEFRRSARPTAFPANPQSMLCSERYCPAWGTQFCRAHKGAE